MPDRGADAIDPSTSTFRYEFDPVAGAIWTKNDDVVFEHLSGRLAEKFSAGHSEHFAACFTFIHPFRHIESRLPVISASPEHMKQHSTLFLFPQ